MGDVLTADEVAKILAQYHPQGEPWPKHIHALGRSHEELRRLAADLLRQADGKPAARALRDVLAGVAAGPQATPQVLWEGQTSRLGHEGVSELYVQLDVSGGTRVRVVAAPTSQEDR